MNLFCLGQNSSVDCDLVPNIYSDNGARISLSTITETEYLRLLSHYPNTYPWKKINSDSAEYALSNKFPKIFKKVNACYRFKSIKNKETTICKNIPAKGTIDKDSQDYKIVDIFSKYVTFISTGYESEVYYIIDTEKNIVFTIAGRPNYSASFRFAYSHANTYGDETISIIDFINERDVCLSFYGWRIEEGYFVADEGYRVKMVNYTSSHTKYLDIHLF